MTALLDIQPHHIPEAAGQKKYWCNLQGSAGGLAIAELAAGSDKTLLVICDNSQQAHELEEQVHFYNPQLPLLHFPDWETLPYDRFSPHQDIISDRLRCLYQLSHSPRAVLFVPVTTLMQRISPPTYIARNSLQVKTGQTLDITELCRTLEAANYQRVNTVYEHGEFAVRGSIVDVFPMGSELPYRIEWFDVEVEKIKTFTPDSQLTAAVVDAIDILPAREFPLDKDSVQLFEDNWYRHFEDISLKETHFHQDLKQCIGFPGIEFYLPLFFDSTASLLDHLPGDALLVSTANIEANCRRFWHEIQLRYEQYRVDRQHPLLAPEQVFIPENELFGQCKQHARIIITDQQQHDPDKGFYDFTSQVPTTLTVDAHAASPYQAISDYLGRIDHPVLFCAETLGRKEALLNIFRQLKITVEECRDWQTFVDKPPAIGLAVTVMDAGLNLDKLELVTESQLFGNRVQQRRRRKASQDSSDTLIKSLTELKEGDAVVHIDHGIGRYQGLQVIDVGDAAQEFLTLRYADDALLYVPVTSLHLITRYSGADPEHAPLHRLGNDQWQKTKRKAAEQVHDVAAELLDIYARRAAQKGFSHQAYSDAYRQFAADFPFEETADQTDAIARVLGDMASSQPMDRLVCGDVGFGKTEVAMRAAFTAVHNNKQVAVLVPTTLLAQQHYDSFVDRFADTPVSIEVLSRFRTASEQQQVIKKLAEGKIDILIGTHKLLQADVKFSELGLVIIDEEHRFGVKQKEKLKALRAQVDVLALTATPIPRTLNMSMAGMRDLSIIATPPARRLSIKTFVREREDRLVKEAILRELLRGGQVYYLHNEVKTIENTLRELQALVPEARIGIGHGQMRERELERVMSDFYHKRFNILLCTTIIETGIDVPNANTIIIERADTFGLAQLHQLRGRVGRSHHQAYAYLLTPPHKKITRDADKRLQAISEATDLGAGFTLATHDLEIRGAGELLGDEQSGQIQSLGFSLYMDMLDKAVKAIQRGETPNLAEPLQKGTEVNLNIAAIIPQDYLPDVHTRLTMYKTIANCQSQAELDDCKIMMIDRFGLLPPALQNLFAVTALKLRAEKLGLARIETNRTGGKFEFDNKTTVDPMKLVTLVQSQPQIFRLDGSSVLRFKQASETVEERLQLIDDILNALTG